MGSVRLKHGGGHGGHNGLRDTIAHIGDAFWRLRIGIGHPGNKTEVIDYVLTRPPRAEEDLILDAVNVAADCMPVHARTRRGARDDHVCTAARERPDAHPLRNRRTAECRQIDAVQCADARRRSPRRTIRSAPSTRTSAWCPVPDPRLEKLAAIVHPERILPTTVEFVDIAGLVAGASKGEGLGNKFLAHIREVDAIAHVVRCFENDDIIHVAGKIDPASDIEVINTELALADLDSVERAYQKALKAAKTADKEAVRMRDVLERVRDAAEPGEAGALAGARRQRACAAARPAPADRQAGDVRRQRRRERLHEQPAARPGARARGGRGCGRGAGVRGHRGGDRAARGGRPRRFSARS